MTTRRPTKIEIDTSSAREPHRDPGDWTATVSQIDDVFRRKFGPQCHAAFRSELLAAQNFGGSESYREAQRKLADELPGLIAGVIRLCQFAIFEEGVLEGQPNDIERYIPPDR